MKNDHNEMVKNVSRRDFLKTASFAVGTVGALAATHGALAAGKSESTTKGSAAKKSGLSLSLAGYPYDRVEALIKGKAPIEGCEINYEIDKIGGLNTHAMEGPQTRHVTEIGLHPFMLAYANENFRDYTLLPIFPLRTFRHKSIFIRTDRGINSPEDLRGKTIATPGYSSTSLTWIRGLLQDEYGITPHDVQWVTSAKDSSADISGSVSKQENVLPDGIEIKKGTPGKDESDLLESGEVDALFHAIQPRGFAKGHPKIARLFADSRATEQTYYQKTGIFPIMHAVAIRKDTLKQNPWLAKAVFDAYSTSKKMNYNKMIKLGWALNSLPWFGQELEDTQKIMGQNFYSYGMEPNNRKTLDALFRYSHQQGLASRQLTVEELFAPEGLMLVES